MVMVKRNQRLQLVGDRMQTVASDVNVACIIDPTVHPEIPPKMFYCTITMSLLFREDSH